VYGIVCPPQNWTTIIWNISYSKPNRRVASADEDKWGTLQNVYWRMTRRDVLAPRKGRCRLGTGTDNVARGVPKRTDVREETTDATGSQQWNNVPRLKGAAASEEGEVIRQDLQQDSITGSREASSWIFHRAAESEWLDIVEGSAPSETKENTTSILRIRNMGVTTTLGTFVRTDRRKIVVIHLERQAPYEGVARGEPP
jgi:hypothetical protein